MKIPIQEWLNSRLPISHDDYINGMQTAPLEQGFFARDVLSRAVARSYEEYKSCAWVIGEHRSKSRHLPVILLERPDLVVVMRNNFYNVAISIKRTANVAIPAANHLITEGLKETVSGCYCEGFPSEWLFGLYAPQKQAFTVHVGDRYDAYALIRLASLSS